MIPASMLVVLVAAAVLIAVVVLLLIQPAPSNDGPDTLKGLVNVVKLYYTGGFA